MDPMVVGKTRLKLGIDGSFFSQFLAIPEAIRTGIVNFLEAVLNSDVDFDVEVFLPSEVDATNFDFIKKCRKKVALREEGGEVESDINFFHIPDQLSLLPARNAPLLFVPKTIPSSVYVADILPAVAAKNFLIGADSQKLVCYFHALEMLTSSASSIFTSNFYEAEFISALTRVPLQQIHSVGLAAAVGKSFRSEDSRWDALKTKFKINSPFIVVPTDTLGESSEEILNEYVSYFHRTGTDLLVVRPKLSGYLNCFASKVSSDAALADSHLFNLDLNYEEFLEILSRSQALFLPGDLQSTFGIAEAKFFAVPVFITKSSLVEGIVVSGPEDFIANITRFAKRDVLSRSIERDWAIVANRAIHLWKSLLD